MRRSIVLTELYRQKEERPLHAYHAYCTAVKPLVGKVWRHPDPLSDQEWESLDYPIAAGTTLRINMVSRLGDFGVTDDLSAERGYKLRLLLGSRAVTDFRFEP